ncbi:MAG TPA: histidinol dehydrogenase [Gammaproteobacteria bacterium]|nr:histidinol dehydrogenase [Gammaproteobacteria bacterium]|tara:strand:- start:49 stop:1398 length:1350 start_codon:yes stop_codon:yes gene_type:complete
MVIQQLITTNENFEQQFSELLHWDMRADSAVDKRVAEIIAQVRERGDAALLELTNQLDRRELETPEDFRFDSNALLEAWHRLQPRHQQALQLAAERIRLFHQRQLDSSWSFEDELGNRLGQRISSLERVGVYVPGGQAAYPSTVLMTVIPATVAGVEDIVVTVPTPDDSANDMVLAALHLTGASQVFSVGGAQAIAAMAYGTETVPRVDKIVGPGGAYVATAKKQVFGQVGIDMIAGPSEVLILADGTTPVDWAVLDLFSQAEHDASAQSILISPDRDYVAEVVARIEAMLPTMERESIIRQSLRQRGAVILCSNKQEALDLANRIAPEHLELAVAAPEDWLNEIRHAGAIFCGAHTAETFGDYVAGPSHVLPTFGTARFASPLGVYDFQKRTSVVEMSARGASALAAVTDTLAQTEGLFAHAKAAALRGGANEDAPISGANTGKGKTE